MTGIAFIFITVVMGVFAGSAAMGGEPVMAMRGNPPDGSAPTNLLIGIRPGGAGEEPARAPAETLAAPGVEEPMGKGREARLESLLQWKDHCARTPRLVAGQALPVACDARFGLVPRFVERRKSGAARFIELLFEGTVPGTTLAR